MQLSNLLVSPFLYKAAVGMFFAKPTNSPSTWESKYASVLVLIAMAFCAVCVPLYCCALFALAFLVVILLLVLAAVMGVLGAIFYLSHTVVSSLAKVGRAIVSSVLYLVSLPLRLITSAFFFLVNAGRVPRARYCSATAADLDLAPTPAVASAPTSTPNAAGPVPASSSGTGASTGAKPRLPWAFWTMISIVID